MSAESPARSAQPDSISPVFSAYFVQQLVHWFSRHGSVWSGTPGELLKELNTALSGRPLGYQYWPRDGSQLLSIIYRNSSRISRSGIQVSVIERPGSPRYISLSWTQGMRPARNDNGSPRQFGEEPQGGQLKPAGEGARWRDRAHRLAIVFRNLTLPKMLTAFLVVIGLSAAGVLGGLLLRQSGRLSRTVSPAGTLPSPRPAGAPAAQPGSMERARVSASSRPASSPVQGPAARPQSVAANSRVGDRDAALQATIYDWIESWKRHDLQRHVAIYAPVLDTYFTKHNVTRDQVYKDKKYSFWLYTRVHQYDLRDLRIQWRSANEAVATFRKKWDFSGRKRFSGDEIEALTLVRTGAGWQIKTEREVKVLHRYHS